MYAVKFEKLCIPVCAVFKTKEEAEEHKSLIEKMMPGTQVIIEEAS